MASPTLLTLDQFIEDRERDFPEATGEFSQLLRDICLAARVVNREVNRAGLVDILGATGETNVQGEEVKKLDEFANTQFLNALRLGQHVCVVGSEENEEIIPMNGSNGKYVVLMDPLDGSSNIDVNVSIGTIFSIYKRTSKGLGPGTKADCLQPGTRQLAAGYVVYGSSTMLVYTTGNGVNAFTLDPTIGEFLVSHQNIRFPERCKYYSLNDGQAFNFSPGIQAYLEDIRERNRNDDTAMRPRYIGSLVADFHRNLLKGGVFLYPGTQSKPQGKLRLLYEANPMAFLAEQAGGAATNGTRRILELQPETLHQRVPLVIGHKNEVKRVQQLEMQHTPKAV